MLKLTRTPVFRPFALDDVGVIESLVGLVDGSRIMAGQVRDIDRLEVDGAALVSHGFPVGVHEHGPFGAVGLLRHEGIVDAVVEDRVGILGILLSLRLGIFQRASLWFIRAVAARCRRGGQSGTSFFVLLDLFRSALLHLLVNSFNRDGAFDRRSFCRTLVLGIVGLEDISIVAGDPGVFEPFIEFGLIEYFQCAEVPVETAAQAMLSGDTVLHDLVSAFVQVGAFLVFVVGEDDRHVRRVHDGDRFTDGIHAQFIKLFVHAASVDLGCGDSGDCGFHGEPSQAGRHFLGAFIHGGRSHADRRHDLAYVVHVNDVDILSADLMDDRSQIADAELSFASVHDPQLAHGRKLLFQLGHAAFKLLLLSFLMNRLEIQQDDIAHESELLEHARFLAVLKGDEEDVVPFEGLAVCHVLHGRCLASGGWWRVGL